MTDKPTDPVLAALSSGTGRSPVYRWLRRNHQKVQAALDAVGTRPNWQGLADLLASENVKNGQGNPPSAATVRDQWSVVLRDLGRQARKAPKSGAETPQASGAVRTALTMPEGEPPPADENDGFAFVGGRKDWKGSRT